MGSGFLKNTLLKAACRLLLYLASLEVLLRLGGWGFLKVQELENRQMSATRSQYTIMCVGDSNTALGGENSYPSQLEKILRQRAGPRYRVLNKGIPAADSTVILKDLESWLMRYKPDMVVAMMGANDRFEPQPTGRRPFPLLGHLQLTKLVKGLYAGIKGSIPSSFLKPKPPASFQPVPVRYVQMLIFAIHARENGDCDTSEKILFALAHVPGIEPTFRLRAASEAGVCFEKRKEYGPFMWSLFVALEENEFDVGSIDAIRKLMKKGEAKEQIQDLLTQLVREKPGSMPLTGLLGACYAQWGDKKMADFYLEKLESMRQQGEILPLEKNYITLDRLLRERHIRGVFVQYPMRDVELLKRMLEAQKDYGSLIFVDNRPAFREALRPEKYYDYFTDRNYDDLGHCTPKGNYILAGNIADAILKRMQ